jgi:Mannosyltransferase (PIG-V)
MRLSPAIRNLILIWLCWALIVIGFQTLVQERLQPNRPDRATEWTPNETARTSQRGKIYLLEPFMNNQVSWDSEFYLSIATAGYDDPAVRLVDIPGGQSYAMNYAFFPFYPLVMQIVRAPFTLLPGMTPIAASTLAGVLVALVGTLAGMLALYDLVRDRMGDEGGLRAAFYLLIFPTGFFLAQVYTEGLFIGLAFGCLALLHRQRLLPAAILAALATLTRSVGVFLVIPLALAWLAPLLMPDSVTGKRRLLPDAPHLMRALLVLLPVAAYILWRVALGTPFDLVQTTWFGRGAFDWARFTSGIERALEAIRTGENNQMRVYFLMEFASVILAAVACLFTLRRYTAVSLFGLVALVIAFTSGSPQSLMRYILVVPPVFIMLASLGKATWFDRSWTVLSLLLMGMQVSLFTWDMWVA